MLSISATFDSGNIEVNSIDNDKGNVELKIRDDPFSSFEQTTFKQWFHFRSSGCGGREVCYSIINAGDCAYPEGFQDYTVCTSYDRKYWFRLPTSYNQEGEGAGALRWTHTAEHDQVYFAYFAPFSQEQHLDLLAECNAAGASLCTLGQSLDGRPLDMVTLGDGPLNVWAIARQHPGESQGAFWMQGFLRRLLDPHDALARSLLRLATFRVVPCMNPDGAFRGHLRTNAGGANLNREWRPTGDYEAPSLARSPEVLHVLAALHRHGCDMFMDLHGDEKLPFNFLSGSEGVPKWQHGPRLGDLQSLFVRTLMEASPDMQDQVKYPINAPGAANLSVASKHVAETFDCLSFTIEMPYKDTANQPCPTQGWCPERANRFGACFVSAVAAVLPQLR